MKTLITRMALAMSLAATLAAVAVGTTHAATSKPTANTTRAYYITDATAAMYGRITPNGVAVKWQMFWGPNASKLNHTTPERLLNPGGHSTGTISVGANTNAKLAPGTKYYYELVIYSQGANSKSFSHYTTGGFTSFTTKPGAVTVGPYKFTAHNDVVRIPVHCFGVKACDGTLQISERVKRSPNGTFYRTATFGLQKFSIAKNETGNVDVHLTAGGVTRLRAAENRMLRLRMRVTTTTGQPLFFNYIRVTL